MPSRNDRRRRPLDDEIERILREAEQVLREVEAPSGGWPGSRPAPGNDGGWVEVGSGVAGPDGGGWPGIGAQGLDAEAAFWLLFPPRGNA
jgi:hypothetical protein